MDWTPFEQYLTAKDLSKKTIEEYGGYFRRLSNMIGDIPLNQEIVNAFISDNKNIVCRAFLKNYLHFIRNRDIEIPKVSGRRKKEKIMIITPEHHKMFRDYFYDKRFDYGFIYDLIHHGALRLSEVFNIKLRDFNLNEIQSGTKDYVTLLVRGKGNKQRKVVLPRLLLKGILLYASEMKFTMDENIFKFKSKSWQRYFNRACQHLGFYTLENGKMNYFYHTHSIRHSKTTEWYESGIDIVKLQHRLGHSNISTTRLYITPDEKKMEEEWSQEYK